MTTIHTLHYELCDFDSSYGYPGEGPEMPQINMISLNIRGAGTDITKSKYTEIIHWMTVNKIHISFLQETHSKSNTSIQEMLQGTEYISYESPNINNHNKGGTAIIIHKDIQHTLVSADTEVNWHNQLTANEQLALPLDQITGRWIHIKITLSGTEYNIVNHYYPSKSHKARLIHNKHIKTYTLYKA